MKARQGARCRVRGYVIRKNCPPPKTALLHLPKTRNAKVVDTWMKATGDEEMLELPIYKLRCVNFTLKRCGLEVIRREDDSV